MRLFTPILKMCQLRRSKLCAPRDTRGNLWKSCWGKVFSRKSTQSSIYYWPTLQKDAHDLIRACNKCQRFANIQTRPGETMTPISLPWPFAQWGIDIMGPFPLGEKQLRFLIVSIDYFTKWVEAEPVTMITEAKVTSFVWKNISCKFRVLHVIISDNGK